MSLIDQVNIIKYHNKRIRDYEDDHKKLGWKNPESQLLRFESLIDGIDLNYSSVLDIGCGYADFKTYLDKHFNHVSYTGIDLVLDFVYEASRRFANDRYSSFIHGDFSTTLLTEVDYVFCCGALCYKNSDPEYPFKMIRKMFYTSRKGCAFCMLDAKLFPEHSILTGFSKKEVIRYCKSIADKVVVNDNYLLEDFSVKMMHR